MRGIAGLFIAAVESMTPLLENATSAIDPKRIEVTVLTGGSIALVYFPGSVGNVCALINTADSLRVDTRPVVESNRDYVEQEFAKEWKTLPERDGEGEDKESIAATVALPGDHGSPPVLAWRDKRSPTNQPSEK